MTWSAVKFAPYNSSTECIFALNGTELKRIESGAVHNWGIAAPIKPPTLSAKADGALTGNYFAKYSYCRTESTTVVCESNLSPAPGAAESLSAEFLRITFTPPPDGQVNMIRFYRTAAAGTSYYLDSAMQYPNGDYGVTQTWEGSEAYETGDYFKFTVEDSGFGSEDCFAWEQYARDYDASDSTLKLTTAGDVTRFFDTEVLDAALGTAEHTDHDPPPSGGDQVFGPTYDGTLFIINGHKLYYSKPKQPEYWPPTYYVLIGPPHYPGKCGVIYDKAPFVLTRNRLIFVYGTGATDFLPKETAAKTGTISARGAVAIEGLGIFHVALDGIYLAQPATDSRLGQDIKVTSAFERTFRGETVNGVEGVGNLENSWLFHYRNKLIFGYPGQRNTYPANFLVFYLDSKQVGYWTRGQEITSVCEDFENSRLLATDSTGYVWILEDKTVTDDNGTAISWEVETKEFTLQTRAHFPRWNKYDIKSDGATGANAYLMLDGVVHHTHALNDNRNTKRRLVSLGNGERCSIRINGSGPVEIYAVESE